MKTETDLERLATDPKRIGGYKLIGRLGAGGMGVVYLGSDGRGVKVAVKVIRSELARDASFRSRFRREVEAARRVEGAHTARVIKADTDSSPPYLVTEFIAGPTLDRFIEQRGPLQGAPLRVLALALAEALGAIHRVGLVHRDLKPTNILVSPDGPKVIDFGIARAADATSMTMTGITLGTPAWMAPEQARGLVTGAQADVFAWGALVAYAGTGRPPFGWGTADAMLYRVVHEDPDLSGLDRDLVPLVERSLAKDAAARPTSVEVLNELLGGESITFVDQSASDRISSIVERTWHQTVLLEEPSPSRPPNRLFLLAALLAISCIVAAAGWLMMDVPSAISPTSPKTISTPDEESAIRESTNPVPDPVPDARSKRIGSLLRAGTSKTDVLYGDMDGEAPEEIVLASAEDPDDPFSQRFIDVFAWSGSKWKKIFDASRFVASGDDVPLLGISRGDPGGNDIPFLRLIDFHSDGSEELVAAVQSFGASPGPLELHVLTQQGTRLKSAHREVTTRGGTVSQIGATIELTTGSYTPADVALCCPSFETTKTIGAKKGDIRVLSSIQEPISSSDAPLSSESRLRLDGIARITVGMTLEEASEAAGMTISLPAGTVSRGCGYAQPESEVKGLSFMVQGKRIVRVNVSEGYINTLSGVGIGTSEDIVMKTYPGQLEVREHPYDPSGHYLVYEPEEQTELSLIFETDGRQVTSFRSGRRDAVGYIEGCS
ncbi:MAG: serine/threonine protein kinase [Actinomycetota bacterium]